MLSSVVYSFQGGSEKAEQKIDSKYILPLVLEEVYYDADGEELYKYQVEYDSEGKKTKESRFELHEGEYALQSEELYDLHENVVKSTDYDYGDGGWSTTDYENIYDEDKLIEVKYKYSHDYDPIPNDGGYIRYEYEYDEKGRVVTRTGFGRDIRYSYSIQSGEVTDKRVEQDDEEVPKETICYFYAKRGQKTNINEKDTYLGSLYQSGDCGNNMSWELYTTDILVLSGNGDMIDFDYLSSFDGSVESPWKDYSKQIRKLILEDGITSIGNGAFYNCTSLIEAVFPESLVRIGEGAFQSCERLLSVSFPSKLNSIEVNSFMKCTSLYKIAFNGSQTLIGYGAFDDCPKLADYSLPNAVKLKAIDEGESIFEFNNKTWIEKPDGSVLISTENNDFTSIYAYGGGYYALYRYEEGFSANEAKLTIMSQDGVTIKSWTWNQDEDILMQLSRDALKTDNRAYCGETVFLLWGVNGGNKYSNAYIDARYINCSTGNEFTIKHAYMGPIAGSSMMYGNDDVGSYLFKISDNAPFDYVNYYDSESWTSSWKTYIVSSDGIVADLGSNVTAMGDYSDGGFIFAWYDDGWNQDDIKLKFYDCKTGSITDICRDNDKLIKSDICNYKFLDGGATIHLRGADGNIYTAIVDKQGNYIQEPQAQ